MTLNIKISPTISAKLTKKHAVSEAEVHECFANIELGFLVDDREEHRTDPPTHWFIAETDHGRRLKVCFVPERVRGKLKCIHLKTAFPADKKSIDIYEKHALKG